MNNRISSESADITQANIEKLKNLFPEIVTDGNKIDFETLQTILGEEIDTESERYSFTWPGKKAAIEGSQIPSKGTLRPNKEKSKHFDQTENLYIEGDNLEVLKLLQKSYNNKIKVIYIDPPYNTGKDFVYKDNFRKGVDNYLEQTGQVDSEGNVISTNSESNGRFHTDWLNMMYPRLRLARNLLTDDGVIFISIDDAEQANLKKMCDEVFGEQNFITNFIWTKTSTPPSLSNKNRKTAEYVMVYEKKINNTKYFGSFIDNGDAPLLNSGNQNKKLTFPVGTVFFTNNKSGIVRRESNQKIQLLEDININNHWNTNEFTAIGEFKWTQERLNNEIDNGTYLLVKSDQLSIRFQRVNQDKIKTPNNNLSVELNKENDVLTNEAGVKELEILGLKGTFDYPKPISLLSKLLNMKTYEDKNSIILDFFSGSSTTAHSVMQLNAEDGGQRKYIMVQLPEFLDEKSSGYKDGYRTIPDIAAERIRRAGDKIISENPEVADSLDIGFKYLELDKSNIKEWNTDFNSLEEEIDLFEDIFVEGRTELDVVYEIMLKNGLELTLPLSTFEVNDKTIYDIAFGAQFICLADDIDMAVAQAIIDKRNEYDDQMVSGVVFKDSGFSGDDATKLNVIQAMIEAGFNEETIQSI